MRRASILLLLLTACAHVPPDDVSLPPRERAIRAHGGQAALERASVIALRAEGTYTAREQAVDPREATVSAGRVYSYLIDLPNRRLRREAELLYPGGVRFHGVALLDGDRGHQWDALRWRQGTDLGKADPKDFATLTRLLPHLVLLQSPAAELQLDERGRVASAKFGTQELRYSDYRAIRGVQIPRRIDVSGGPIESVRLTEVHVRPRVEATSFVVPPGYVEPPPAGTPSARELAPGAWLLENMPAGYHAMFVDNGTSVSVIEAPLNDAWTEAALKVIAATLPGKPVSHVFLTHHHGDHTGGLGAYIAAGATVVAGRDADVALRRQLGARAENAKFEIVTERRTIAGVDVIPAPSTHAATSLLFRMHDVVFQGDFFYVPERGEPPVQFPVARELAAAIHGLNVKTLAGAHGRPAAAALLGRE
jgi:glyoxylase-like metal-dependent hydrolase (beta-lactamase superfamily II)